MPARASIDSHSRSKSNTKSSSSTKSKVNSSSNKSSLKEKSGGESQKVKSTSNSLTASNKSSSSLKKDQNVVTIKNTVNTSRISTGNSPSVSSSNKPSKQSKPKEEKSSIKSTSKPKEEKSSTKSTSKPKEEKSSTKSTKSSAELSKGSSSRKGEKSSSRIEKPVDKPDNKRKSAVIEKDTRSSNKSSSSTKTSSKSSSRSEEKGHKKKEEKDNKSKKNVDKEHKDKETKDKKKDEKFIDNKIADEIPKVYKAEISTNEKKIADKKSKVYKDDISTNEKKIADEKSKVYMDDIFINEKNIADEKSKVYKDEISSNEKKIANEISKVYKDEISSNAKIAEFGIKDKEFELQNIDIKDELKIDSPSENVAANVNPSPNSLETVESGISLTSPNDLSDGEVEESISSRFVEVDEMEGLADDIEYSSPPSSSANLLQSTASLADSKSEEEDKEESPKKKEEEEEYMNYEEEKSPKKEEEEEEEYMNYKEEKSSKKEEEEEEEYTNYEDVNYEDDFENYESDFDDDDDDDAEGSDDVSENDSDDDESDEDEDSEESNSGEEGIPEPDLKMKAILKAIQEENSRPKVAPAAVSQRNPQDVKQVQESGTTNVKTKPNRPKTSKAYVNFNRAKERAKGEKASEKIKNRGQLLQEMIQLDTIAIDLFIQISDSYESYIAAFGRSNTIQASIQTNEEALSEGVQTDPLTMLDKWTQKPIYISFNGDSLPTPEDYLGVGGDTVADEVTYDAYKTISSDTSRLTKFLSGASQVILMLLEEDSILNEDSLLNAEVDENLGFSKFGIGLGNGLASLLEGRKSTLVSFCPSDPSLVLTGHAFYDLNNNASAYPTQQASEDGPEEPEDDISSFMDKSALLCLWSVNQPSFPQRILTCRSPPSVACFNPGRPIIVLAGLTDGSLAAWDFRESLANHPVNITLANRKWRLSPPSFITACSREGVYEGSAIVALETVGSQDEQSLSFGSFQVVSLSAMGQITWWVLVQGEIQPTKVTDMKSSGLQTDLGAAPWSRISMSRAATISIDDVLHSEEELTGSVMCYDLKLSGNDSNQLLVATANGNVAHCSRHNMKMHPSQFTPEIEPGTEAVSISICPHDPLYFLVGGNDGLIRLHSATSSLPLTCWQASNNPAPVKKIEWSPSRPCVFYMLDVVGMFHIWDLSAGDIYPITSVEDGGLIGGQLINFNLANFGTDGSQPLYAVFASETGAVGIRSISAQFLRSSEEEYKNELERFRCYVSII